MTKTVELTYPGSLVVTLGSNPTTGFQWDANPGISDATVLSQYDHNFVVPTSTLVGAPGKDVWTFKPMKTGTATVSFSYSRPTEITYDEFSSQPHVTKTVELTYPGSLVVTLGSNPTTGFQWGANPGISDATVLSQYEHNFVSPTTTLAGAPGKDVWTFKPLKTGTATVSFSYSRPWEGGEKDVWTVTLTVEVK